MPKFLNSILFLIVLALSQSVSAQYKTFEETYDSSKYDRFQSIAETALLENLGGSNEDLDLSEHQISTNGTVTLVVHYQTETSTNAGDIYNPTLKFQISIDFNSNEYEMQIIKPEISGGLMAFETMPMAQLIGRHQKSFYGQLLFPDATEAYSEKEQKSIQSHYDYYETIISQSNTYFDSLNMDLLKRINTD